MVRALDGHPHYGRDRGTRCGVAHPRRADRQSRLGDELSTTSSSAASSSNPLAGASATCALPKCRDSHPGTGFPSGRGRHTGRVHWPPRDDDRKPVRADALPLSRNQGRRLHRVLGRPGGHPGARALGADVIKIEGVGRPDGMRFAGGGRQDGAMVEWGPVFLCSNTEQARHQYRAQ